MTHARPAAGSLSAHGIDGGSALVIIESFIRSTIALILWKSSPSDIAAKPTGEFSLSTLINAQDHHRRGRASQLHEGSAARGSNEAAQSRLSLHPRSHRPTLRRRHVAGVLSRSGNARAGH